MPGRIIGLVLGIICYLLYDLWRYGKNSILADIWERLE